MAGPGDFDIQWTSERSLRVSGPMPAHAAAGVLRGVSGIRDVVPTEGAVYLTVDPLGDVTPDKLAQKLKGVEGRPAPEPRVHEIAVCYEPPHAMDLAEVARLSEMAEHEVVEAHTSTEFTVAFLGFAPGFGYLTGLPERLHVPRLASPRTRLEAGSVGVAGPYSGVYGLPGPGGWRIIGRTKAVMFGVEREEPALLRAGDVVRFRSITAREFDA
ncbi:MAG: 5-oxoprolinase subunit PxpB [Phycisphaera sp.]|nr:MAG: 5-oxoprolinase subunit PxpB [Phycisphaera sp.]